MRKKQCWNLEVQGNQELYIRGTLSGWSIKLDPVKLPGIVHSSLFRELSVGKHHCRHDGAISVFQALWWRPRCDFLPPSLSLFLFFKEDMKNSKIKVFIVRSYMLSFIMQRWFTKGPWKYSDSGLREQSAWGCRWCWPVTGICRSCPS